MKIVLVITDYGSFNNFLGDLAIRLAKDGHHVSVITSELRVINIQDKFDYVGEGIEFSYVDFPRGFNPFAHYKASKRIRRILDRINPDLVHIHFTTGIFTALFVGRLPYKTLGTFHGLGFPVLSGIKKQIFGVVERFCFNRLDRIYVLNEVDFQAVSRLGYKNVQKYETLGLGCDLKVFNPVNYSEQGREQLKTKLGIHSDDFVFTYTGRFVDFKGYDKVIRSFLSLYPTHPNAKLILIGGSDPIHHTGLTVEEEKLMAECGGVVNIGFTQDVASYLSITDVFVFPSVKEGMPVCVIEALAMEVPVITSDSRGCNEIVYDGHNGFVVDVANKQWRSVARRMKELLIDKDKLTHFKANIKQDRDKYDRERYIFCEIQRFQEWNVNT